MNGSSIHAPQTSGRKMSPTFPATELQQRKARKSSAHSLPECYLQTEGEPQIVGRGASNVVNFADQLKRQE